MRPNPASPSALLGALVAAALVTLPAAAAEEVDPDADSLPVPEPPAVALAEPREAPASKPAEPSPRPQPEVSAATLVPEVPRFLLVAQNPPEATTDPEGPQRVALGNVTVYGDQIERDPATGVFVVTGNPRAVYGADELRANRLIIDPLTQDFTAEGNVVITQGGRVIRATRANYRFVEREGQAEDVQEQFGTYYIRAERMLLRSGPIYEALRATFTTCAIENDPHYKFYSRRIEVSPNKELIARDLGIDLLGHRLLTIPRLRKSLVPGDDDRRSLYPSLGYNRNSGFYVREEFNLRRSAPVWIDADAQLNTMREPSGGIMTSTAGTFQLRTTAYFRDTAENQRVRFLQVTRLPEIGIVWSPNGGPAPGQFLPHQVGGVRYPRALNVSRDWRLAAELSAGYFRQHRGDRVIDSDSRSKWGARVKAQAQGVLPQVDLGPLRLNDLRLLARHTLYDTGDAFTVLGTGIGKRVRFGNLQLGIQRLDQFTTGSTPFMFDDVELRQEWRPRLEYTTPGFNFLYVARIRANNGGLYDQTFSISRLFHCIEPRFTYRVRRGDFFFEIRIPGLSGFSRGRPGEPRTIEADPSTASEIPEF